MTGDTKTAGKYADPWGAVTRKWGRYEADKA